LVVHSEEVVVFRIWWSQGFSGRQPASAFWPERTQDGGRPWTRAVAAGRRSRRDGPPPGGKLARVWRFRASGFRIRRPLKFDAPDSAGPSRGQHRLRASGTPGKNGSVSVSVVSPGIRVARERKTTVSADCSRWGRPRNVWEGPAKADAPPRYGVGPCGRSRRPEW
jgi:hypothetical protein